MNGPDPVRSSVAVREAVPAFFGPADGLPVFGWFDAGSKPAAKSEVGVVFCNTFGREELSAHRTLRLLSSRIAGLGIATVRFDLPGTGNSGGDERSPDLVRHWIAAVGLAADELKRRSGVTRIAFVGLRLGVLLALEAAALRDDVAAVVSIAGVLSGRAFVRELRALAGAGAPAASVAVAVSGDIDSGGFVLSAETSQALAQLNQQSPARSPARQMMVIDRSDFSSSDKWLAKLVEAGVDVTHRSLPGYAELMLDPHRSKVPIQMLDEIEAWFDAELSEAAVYAGPTGDPGSTSGSSDPTLAGAPLRSGDAVGFAGNACARLGPVKERPVWVGADAVPMFGMLTKPVDGTPRSGLLLVNSGGVRNVGPSRLYVTLARQLAALGWAVLRLDISGLGDSEAVPGAGDNVVYSPTAVSEVGLAVDYLRRVVGVEHCQAAGVCSGAYHSFKAAVAGAALDGIVVINPLTFFWTQGMEPGEFVPDSTVVRDMARYRSKLFSREPLRKLFRGQLNVKNAVRVIARSVAAGARGPVRDAARIFGFRFRDDLSRELDEVVRRDVALTLLLASDEPGEALLRLQGGSTARRLIERGSIRIERVVGADHTFSAEEPRGRALQQLLDLFSRAQSQAEMRVVR